MVIWNHKFDFPLKSVLSAFGLSQRKGLHPWWPSSHPQPACNSVLYSINLHYKHGVFKKYPLPPHLFPYSSESVCDVFLQFNPSSTDSQTLWHIDYVWHHALFFVLIVLLSFLLVSGKSLFSPENAIFFFVSESSTWFSR